jgi:lactate dehydrogenase-like 2-hydroxyacid dehydrogenase
MNPGVGRRQQVLVTGPEISPAWLQKLEEGGLRVEHETDVLNRQQIFERLQGVDYYIYGGIEEADLLDKKEFTALASSGLKLISFAGKGVTDFLNVAAANRAGITVTNTPGAVEPSVAEFTILLCLSLLRDSIQRSSSWLATIRPELVAEKIDFDLGSDLSETVVGIVGLGDIGALVAKILTRGFGCDVKYFSRTRKLELEKSLGIEYLSGQEIVSGCGLVTIHLSNTEGARGLVAGIPFEDAKSLLLVNTASQALIDATRLEELLSSGAVRAAAFDKIYKPAEMASSGLSRMTPQRLIVTNHSANATLGAWRRMTEIAVEAVLAHAHGRPVSNIVAGG